MADGVFVREGALSTPLSAAAVAIGELWQLGDGRAYVHESLAAADSNTRIRMRADGVWTLQKATGVVLLDGARAYWDHSANKITYCKNNDRDFYAGRVVGDASSNDNTVQVELNIDPPYDIDLYRSAFNTTFTGTRSLTGLRLDQFGGSTRMALGATSEAQCVDLFSVDRFDLAANPIVEFGFRVISDGAGTNTDVSLGVANGTHASDADSIAESVFIHLDGNNTQINAESDDGTTEVAATDTTADYTEGSAVANIVHCVMDLRTITDILIYVNGAQVLDATTFTLAAATGPLGLLAHVEKSSSTDTYELALDYLRVRYMEQ